MELTDPIHGRIDLSGGHEALVQTHAFTRLRGIRQQGNTFRVTPMANHHRFSHSVGAYAVMAKLVDHFTAITPRLFSDYERIVALTAALLHDVGHGPFSHSFEGVTEIHHEEWSVRIVEEDPEVRGLLDRVPDLGADVTRVLQRQGWFPLVESLLSSALGADKLDYHNRDLFHSPLDLPAVDLDRLISGLAFTDTRLVVAEDRIPEVRKLLAIRTRQFSEIFAHPRVVAYDQVLAMVCRRARWLHQHQGLVYAPRELAGVLGPTLRWTVGEYEELSDALITDSIHRWADEPDPTLRHLAQCFVDDSPAAPCQWVAIPSDAPRHDFARCLDPWNATLYRADRKYGSYSGGIWVQTASGVHDLSAVVPEFGADTTVAPTFLYYVEETPAIRRALQSLGSCSLGATSSAP